MIPIPLHPETGGNFSMVFYQRVGELTRVLKVIASHIGGREWTHEAILLISKGTFTFLQGRNWVYSGMIQLGSGTSSDFSQVWFYHFDGREPVFV